MDDTTNSRRIFPEPPACNHTEGAGHDCRYVDARNALISRAEERASNKVGTRAAPNEWTRAFITAMDDLALENGLVKRVLVHIVSAPRRAA